MPHRQSEILAAFPTTHWSLVARAGVDDLEAKRQSLGVLLTRYMAPLRSHLVIRKRIPPDRADDLLQGFLCSKVLEQDLIGRAERERGRFRNLLMVALDRYVVSEIRREKTLKRRPEGLVSIADDEDLVRTEPAADAAFEVEWARQLLSEAIKRMEVSCKRTGRDDVWQVFQGRILAPTLGQGSEETYESLVKRCGFVSPAQASNVLMTAKRTFARVLRSLIAEYEREPEDIDAEIADLCSILGRSVDGGMTQPQTPPEMP